MPSANEFSLPEILSGSPCFICSRPLFHLADTSGRSNDSALFLHQEPETAAYPEYSACSCKSLQPGFRGKMRKFPRHFKGHFSIGNVQVRILPAQPGLAPGEVRTMAVMELEIIPT